MAKKNLRKIYKLSAMLKNTDDKKLPSSMKRMKTESYFIVDNVKVKYVR
jgi:hypothetical protein